MTVTLIGPGHPRWEEFVMRLSGEEGCDFQRKPDGDVTWTCLGDLAATRRVLAAMGCDASEVTACTSFYQRHGGYCDCEVLLNVESSVAVRGVTRG